jgi:prepilin-type N-terminal cleavage/methylation domain-containing protein
MNRRPQQGFTLIELTIVLGVFAVVVAGIWMVVSTTFENTRQYQANRMMQVMVQNIRQLEMRITRFVNLADITITLDSQQAFPLEMRRNPGTAEGRLNHPWSSDGDSVHVYARDASTFGIEFSHMPKKPCIQIATKLSGGELSGLTKVKINGSDVAAADLPLTVINAATKCTAATSTNIIEWQFNLRGS